MFPQQPQHHFNQGSLHGDYGDQDNSQLPAHPLQTSSPHNYLQNSIPPALIHWKHTQHSTAGMRHETDLQSETDFSQQNGWF